MKELTQMKYITDTEEPRRVLDGEYGSRIGDRIVSRIGAGMSDEAALASFALTLLRQEWDNLGPEGFEQAHGHEMAVLVGRNSPLI